MSMFRTLIESISSVPEKKLPDDYQQVEYIQTDGNQYINTLVNPNSDTKVDIDFTYSGSSSGNSQWKPLFGSRNVPASGATDKSTFFAIYIQHGNANLLKITSNYAGHDPGSESTNYIRRGEQQNINNEGGYFYQGHGQNRYFLQSISTTNVLAQSQQPIYLFDCNNGGTPQKRAQYLKIHACKIYNGNSLIRDFVPCYHKTNGTIGMYDIEKGVFYTNAGTGTFTKGNDYTP